MHVNIAVTATKNATQQVGKQRGKTEANQLSQ